jgi:DNA (cytosine-5)-methyltransferase 1
VTFVELFAGIGGFRLGLERAGMHCVYANELDKQCCEAYERHWPDGTMHRGDIREVDPADIPPHDLLTAGWPCQDLSIAGKRKGIHGERSGLFFELVRLLAGTRTPWILLENVPGLLSANEGRDFGTVLSELDDLGYGVAWRVLDARYFGVPQRRRRVYLVGHLGGPCPSEVLLESASLCGDSAEGGEKGSGLARTVTEEFARCRGPEHDTYILAHQVGGCTKHGRNPDATDYVLECAFRAANQAGVRRGSSYPVSGTPAVAVHANQRGEVRVSEYAGALQTDRSGKQFEGVACPPSDPDRVREAAGVPGRLDVPMCECADGPRYRMLGNAVAVPVIEWIGRRLLKGMVRRA